MYKKLSREEIDMIDNIAGVGSSWWEPVILIVVGAIALIIGHFFL